MPEKPAFRDRGKHALGSMWRSGKLLSYRLRYKLSNKKKGGIDYHFPDYLYCRRHGTFHGHEVKKHLKNNKECFKIYIDINNRDVQPKVWNRNGLKAPDEIK